MQDSPQKHSLSVASQHVSPYIPMSRVRKRLGLRSNISPGFIIRMFVLLCGAFVVVQLLQLHSTMTISNSDEHVSNALRKKNESLLPQLTHDKEGGEGEGELHAENFDAVKLIERLRSVEGRLASMEHNIVDLLNSNKELKKTLRENVANGEKTFPSSQKTTTDIQHEEKSIFRVSVDKTSIPLKNQQKYTDEKRKKNSILTQRDEFVQSVYVVPRNYTKDDGIGELKHFVLDGIDKSSLLKLTDDIDEEGAVWVVEHVRFGKVGRHCPDLVPFVERSLERRKERAADDFVLISVKLKDGNMTGNVPIPPWKIIIIDFDDGSYHGINECSQKLSSLLGKDNIHFATRGHVTGRNIVHISHNEDTPFLHQGEAIDFKKKGVTKFINGYPRVLRYGVRTDYVDYIQEHIAGLSFQKNGKKTAVTVDNIAEYPRPMDVAHFWNIGEDEIRGKHRTEISKAVLNLAAEKKLTAVTEIKGLRAQFGRNHVNPSYIETMMKMKIVVVCQRDHWEGHYRLMEALLSGAMTMTDPQHPLPLYVENATNVIVYNSIAQLKQQILYYLEHDEERMKIAQAGHKVVMDYHQSSIWMERMIFGNWSTPHGI